MPSVPLAAVVLCMTQLGGSVGIAPMTVGTVVVKTIAAILAVTIGAAVKVPVANILIANGTWLA